MPLISKAFSNLITFTRASSATYFAANGVLTSAANNEPRFDYDPATYIGRGILIEESRTNSIRNNTMQGAAAGTPGTLPTNWVITGAGLGTLVQEVVAVSSINGISYIDIKLSGTTSTTNLSYSFEPSTGGPAASSGQTWTNSNYVALVGGAITNITAIRAASILGRTAGGATTTDNFNSGDNKASLTATLQRFSITGTLADATTVSVQPSVGITFASGVVIGDPVNGITLRIGLPQLENNNTATGVASATVAAGGTGYAVGDVLQIVGGSGTAARLTVATLSGSAVATVTVSTAGNYTTFPSPQPVSVTAITGTGSSATFNIVPQSQNGVATSVILTTTTALTRNGDSATVATLAPWYNASEGTLYADVAIDYTVPATKFPLAASLNDNTSNNRIELGFVTSVVAAFEIAVGGSLSARYPSVAALNRRIAGAYKASDSAISVNGGAATATSPVSASLPTVTQLKLGDRTSGSQLNGWVRRITYYPRRLSNANLTTLTT